MRVMHAWLTTTLALGACECGPPPPDPDGGGDGGVPIDGAPDAPELDAGWEGGPATGMFPDAAVDGEVDGGEPDAGVDPCATCLPFGPCDTAMCIDGVCLRAPVPDGTACDEMATMICVEGACVLRECGDGYREPGPMPDREGCDDGNDADGDACSAMCEPTVFVVQSRDDGVDSPAGAAPSVGIEGSGAALFVWVADVPPATPGGETTRAIRARRYSRIAAEEDLHDAFITIADEFGLGAVAQPTVTGLASGWVVAWTGRDGDRDLDAVLYRPVPRTGAALGAVRVANETTDFEQRDPRIATLPDGFVIAWTDESGLDPDDELAGVRARRFDPSGAPRGGEMFLASTRRGDQRTPSMAATPDVWLAAWVDSDGTLGAAPSIRARRFTGATPVDAADFPLETSMMGAPLDGSQPAVAALATGDFLVAWVSRTADPSGDIRARVVHASGDPLASTTPIEITMPVSPPRGRVETRPAVAPLAGDAFLVAWQDGGERRAVAFAALSGAMLAPEASGFAAMLSGGLQGDVSLARGVPGVFFAWSDAGIFGAPTSRRSALGFLLPVDGAP